MLNGLQDYHNTLNKNVNIDMKMLNVSQGTKAPRHQSQVPLNNINPEPKRTQFQGANGLEIENLWR